MKDVRGKCIHRVVNSRMIIAGNELGIDSKSMLGQLAIIPRADDTIQRAQYRCVIFHRCDSAMSAFAESIRHGENTPFV